MNILVFIFILISSRFGHSYFLAQRLSPRIIHSKLHGRVAEAKTEQENSIPDDRENMVEIPFKGLVGEERGSLFERPVEVFDPIKNTDDLPGDDGSDEKIKAIQRRIEERVAAMKASNEWDSESGDNFGSDPLAKIPIWETMTMQIKACKPYDSTGDLVLTYGLVLTTSIALTAYLIFLRENFDIAITWWVNTDMPFFGAISSS